MAHSKQLTLRQLLALAAQQAKVNIHHLYDLIANNSPLPEPVLEKLRKSLESMGYSKNDFYFD